MRYGTLPTYHSMTQVQNLGMCSLNMLIHFLRLSKKLVVGQSGVKWKKTSGVKWKTTNKYIQQFYEKEGICLEYSNIEKKPGLRSIAKLMLNPF